MKTQITISLGGNSIAFLIAEMRAANYGESLNNSGIDTRNRNLGLAIDEFDRILEELRSGNESIVVDLSGFDDNPIMSETARRFCKLFEWTALMHTLNQRVQDNPK